MRPFAVALLAILLAPAAQAGARTAADRHAKATLVSCDAAGDTATFRGSMTALRRSAAMQLRVTLQARVPGGGGYKRVVAPAGSTLGHWQTSSPGKGGYVFDQTVENLEDGARYRAVVRFRWRDAGGSVIARTLEHTRPCRQPDPRPNLRVRSVDVQPGPSAGTRTYLVQVVNRGNSEAPGFATGLTVDGTPLADQWSGTLAARKRRLITFTGPRCGQGSTLTATADTSSAVDERDETDNARAVPCPTGARRNARAAA